MQIKIAEEKIIKKLTGDKRTDVYARSQIWGISVDLGNRSRLKIRFNKN